MLRSETLLFGRTHAAPQSKPASPPTGASRGPGTSTGPQRHTMTQTDTPCELPTRLYPFAGLVRSQSRNGSQSQSKLRRSADSGLKPRLKLRALPVKGPDSNSKHSKHRTSTQPLLLSRACKSSLSVCISLGPRCKSVTCMESDSVSSLARARPTELVRCSGTSRLVLCSHMQKMQSAPPILSAPIHVVL